MKSFEFCGVALHALPSGGLYWHEVGLLVVSDLHLGKSERIARLSGQILPPYETIDTLTRLKSDLDTTGARRVICLGDSFDDLQAGEQLVPRIGDWLTTLMAGREWTWIEGNHDPGPINIGGKHRAQSTEGPLLFRHEAGAGASVGEVTGHYHPKAQLVMRGRTVTRPCFLYDTRRLILPAYGTYTGGLRSNSEVLKRLMADSARAILTGKTAVEIPMPRG